MVFDATRPLYDLGLIFLLLMVVAAILSWFPYNPNSPVNSVRRVVYTVTEPVVGVFRRVIPPIGNFDISFLVAFLVVYLVTSRILWLIKV